MISQTIKQLKTQTMAWKLSKPEYATIEEWSNWAAKIKNAQPIKYFLQEDVPHWFYMTFIIRFKNLFWKLMHNFHPQHRYHVIATGLPPGYYDPSTRILHGVMNELVKFYEYSHDRYGWDATPEHKTMFDTMKEVYDWWTVEYPNHETHTTKGKKLPELPELPQDWGFCAVINSKYASEPIVIEWLRISKLHTTNENEWDSKSDEMLHKVITIHKGMWYA